MTPTRYLRRISASTVVTALALFVTSCSKEEVVTGGPLSSPAEDSIHDSSLPYSVSTGDSFDWSRLYSANGTISFVANGIIPGELPVPRDAELVWQSSVETMSLLAIDDCYSIGLILDVPESTGSTVSRLALVLPFQCGTTTHTFTLQEPISWRELAVGATSFGVTSDSRYVISVTRQESAMWQFEIAENHDGPGILDGFRSAVVQLEGDRVDPPWANMRIRFDVDTEGVASQGDVGLTATGQ